MKKLLFILLCLPMIGLGQTAEDYYKTANDYSDNGEYQLGINNYTKALRINPDYAIAYLFRGNAYHALGKYEDAISDYTMSIRIDPNYADAYYKRGISNYSNEKYKDAIADYTKVIGINPEGINAYWGRGLAKEKAGMPFCYDYKKACDLGLENSCERYYKQCR